MGLQHYVNARLWAFRENINDIVTAAQNGYWEDVIHFIGGEGESYPVSYTHLTLPTIYSV